MECNFSKIARINEHIVHIDGQEIPQIEYFC